MRAHGTPFAIGVIVFLFVLAWLIGIPPASPDHAGATAGAAVQLFSHTIWSTDLTGASPAVLVAEKSQQDTSKPAAKPGTTPSKDKDEDEDEEEEDDEEDEDDEDDDKAKAGAPASKHEKKKGSD